MADAGFFRGTSAEQDNRFSNKYKKHLKEMKFAESLTKTVDMTKIKLEVIKPWVTERITNILGMEDDVVIEYVFNQLEAEKQVMPESGSGTTTAPAGVFAGGGVVAMSFSLIKPLCTFGLNASCLLGDLPKGSSILVSTARLARASAWESLGCSIAQGCQRGICTRDSGIVPGWWIWARSSTQAPFDCILGPLQGT